MARSVRSWREPSWLVVDMPVAEFDALSRRYGQLATLCWSAREPVRLRIDALAPFALEDHPACDWLRGCMRGIPRLRFRASAPIIRPYHFPAIHRQDECSDGLQHDGRTLGNPYCHAARHLHGSRVQMGARRTIRIGECAAELDADFPDAVRFGMLTASNPGFAARGDTENRDADRLLQHELERLDLRHRPAVAIAHNRTWKAYNWLVIDPDVDAFDALGRRFG